jgi:hypothetical protein
MNIVDYLEQAFEHADKIHSPARVKIRVLIDSVIDEVEDEKLRKILAYQETATGAA